MIIKNFSEIKKKDSIKIRKFKEQYYMFGNSKCYSLNEMGALVVKYLGKDILLDDFCDKVNEKYKGLNLENVKIDVLNYLAFLDEEKILIHECI